jgi:hypothetical protein
LDAWHNVIMDASPSPIRPCVWLTRLPPNNGVKCGLL